MTTLAKTTSTTTGLIGTQNPYPPKDSEEYAKLNRAQRRASDKWYSRSASREMKEKAIVMRNAQRESRIQRLERQHARTKARKAERENAAKKK